MTRLPILVSVPHAGLEIPDEVEDRCILSADDVVADGDEGAAEIYRLEDLAARFVTTDVARAVVDLNRPETDRRADGVVKTHTCLGVPIYNEPLPESLVESLLEQYHRPYHRKLTESARNAVQLGLDCHTMLAVGPEIGPLPGELRPRICLSNVDGASCPDHLLEALASSLQQVFGFEVARNFPFKGGYITRAHADELPWMQLELSREPFMSNAEKRSRVTEALISFGRSLSRQ